MADGGKPCVLLIDDDESFRGVLRARLNAMGIETECGGLGADLLRLLRERPVDAVLLDHHLPDGDGLSLIPQALELEPGLPVVLVTGHGGIALAVDALRAGAHDFIEKPVDFARFDVTLRNALETGGLRKRVRELERDRRERFEGFIGGSAAMRAVYNTIEAAAPSNAPVFVTGESGTGKELAARALHERSPRAALPMIDINCAAIPRELLESELFGHEKSAFTGAAAQSAGRFEQANGSTLFLDEICEMDPALQAKLLRAVQEQAFYRVGGREKVRVDVRILAATNRDPARAMPEGALREDLYFRLNVIPIHLPPLRERTEDIPLLARHFLERHARANGKGFEEVSAEALALLCAHSWPGNVRELDNTVRQCAILHDGRVLEPPMLPPAIRGREPAPPPAVSARSMEWKESGGGGDIVPLDELEKTAIHNALRITGGNAAETSARLGISQATLYRKIRDYGFCMRDFKK